MATTFKQFLMKEADDEHGEVHKGDKPKGHAEFAYKFEWVRNGMKHASTWKHTTLRFADSAEIAEAIHKANTPTTDGNSLDHDMGWVTHLLHSFVHEKHFYPTDYTVRKVGDGMVKIDVEYQMQNEDPDLDGKHGILTIQEQG